MSPGVNPLGSDKQLAVFTCVLTLRGGFEILKVKQNFWEAEKRIAGA
jgi:hypothetical protein